jgi:hypothetical protein
MNTTFFSDGMATNLNYRGEKKHSVMKYRSVSSVCVCVCVWEREKHFRQLQRLLSSGLWHEQMLLKLVLIYQTTCGHAPEDTAVHSYILQYKILNTKNTAMQSGRNLLMFWRNVDKYQAYMTWHHNQDDNILKLTDNQNVTVTDRINTFTHSMRMFTYCGIHKLDLYFTVFQCFHIYTEINYTI